MPWRPLPRIAFAIAVYPFAPSAPADLPLELGDELYIIEEGGIDGAWLRGYLVAPPSLLSGLTSTKGQTLEARVFSGIFPRSCVEIREYIGGETDGESERDGTGEGSLKNGDMGEDGYPHPIRGFIPPDGLKHITAQQQQQQAAYAAELQKAQANGTVPSSMSSPTVENRARSSSSAGPVTPSSLTGRDGKLPRPPAPVPMLKIGDETPTCADEPLVDEIASCLREWHSTNLHELLLSREYGKLTKLTRLMNRLDMARRQLLHGVLTAQEVEDLHEKIVWDMVKGNKLVNNEIIIRDPKLRGRLLTFKDDVIQITKLTAAMALLDTPTKPASEIINLHHILVEVSDVMNNMRGSSPSLLVAIYRKVQGEIPVRLTESFAAEAPQAEKKNPNRLRTLFSELTAFDIGELSGSDADLYIVIKVQAVVEVKTAAQPPSRSATTGRPPVSSAESKDTGSESSSSKANASSSGRGGKPGRRSLLWGANRLGTARRKIIPPATIEEAPAAQTSPQSEKEGAQRPPTAKADGNTSPNPPQNAQSPSGPPQTAKRDIGVAVLRLRDILNSPPGMRSEHTVGVFAPAEQVTNKEPTHEDWSPIIPEIMKSLTGRFEDCLSVTHVQLKVQCFVAPDVDELIRTTPTALLNIHKTPKIGFPGAPKEPRSDIYVTITEPILPNNASFAHPQRGSVQLTENIDKQNLQLTLEVRKSSGERLERCIFPTSNSPGVTAWRTTAIQRGTAWRQTIRLVIPSQDVPQCHLIMSIADAPNFPFALAWMPLWTNGAFIEDGAHMPLLYVYDKFTSRQENGRGAYLDMEWDSRPISSSQSYALQSGSASTLRIETFLCSTELTQDQVLLGVLNWRSQSADQLSVLLRQLPFVQDVELVKLAVEVWGALFKIITEKSGQDEFEDLVLNNLVVSCGIARDRRFNKDATVKKYIDEVFDYPFVSLPILRSLQRLFARTKDYQNSRHLNATIKSGNLLMHLITQSRKLYLEKQTSLGNSDDGMTSEMFNNEVRKLFASFESLMRNPSPALIISKTLLMQHISEWAVLLREVVPRRVLWELGWGFVESTDGVSGKLLLHRLAMIMEYYKIMMTRREQYIEEGLDIELIDQKVSDWITPYWGATRHLTEQYREQIRLCNSIATLRGGFFGNQYEAYNTKLLDSYLSLRSAGRTHKNVFTPLFPQTYPFPTRQVDLEIPIDEGIVEIAAALVSFRETPLEDNIFDPERIMAVFGVFTSIITGEAYPKSWLTLSLYHHREFLFCCQKFFIYMKQYNLPEPEQPELFRTDLWKALFTTLLTIVSSENLALETFPEQKRRAVWKIAGDVRELGAGLIARCWNAIGWEVNETERQQYGLDRLGGWQVQYVPHLVGPIIELCLSVHAGLRTTAVQIMQSMIISEWSISGDLAVIQHEVVECLNYLLKHKNMTESAQQKLFIIELMDLFEPLAETNDNELWEAFKDLISVVEDLLDLLVVVHSPDTSDAFRTMNTLRLMDFLRDMQKEDIFISYVHQLAETEAQARYFKEAGLALRLHAELYDWDTNKIVEALKSPPFPSQTAFERREQLFFEMIRYFEDGAAYGCALECYRELADQYEQTSFDFAKLARTQRSMAKCFELITKGECQTPRYFKVVYKGLGFPPNLRDKQYIFEGNGSERLVTFTDRLQREHPSARLVSATENTEGEGQYLLVTAVTPYRDLKHPLYQRSKVGFAIKEYVLSNSPVNFAVTTRRHSPKTGVQDQWVEKTVYTTAEVFPTILRRSEVIAEELLPLSPIQTAIERTVRKASELWTLEKRLREGDESSSFNLIDAIKSSVEHNSSSSVAQYREMLPKALDTVAISDEEKAKKPAEDQMQSALRIALSDFTYMLRHCFSTFGRSMPSSEYQKLHSQFQVTFAPEIAMLGPMPAVTTHEVVNPLQFSDPTFHPKPPTLSKEMVADITEAQDMAPTGMSRIKAALNPETRTPSRGNRFSMLLRRKPSTANSNEEPTGSIGNISTKHDRNPFNNIRKYATGASNSSSNINEQRDPPRTADVTSDRSVPAAGNGKLQQGAAARSPTGGADWASRDGASNTGGPVYTAITGAKDAYKQGGFGGSHAGSVKVTSPAMRPPTSHSNNTVTTTGRRLAELRKGLAARKFGGGDGFGPDGNSDVMGVRVDVIQRRYAKKNAARGSRQQLGPMEFINIGRVGVH